MLAVKLKVPYKGPYCTVITNRDSVGWTIAFWNMYGAPSLIFMVFTYCLSATSNNTISLAVCVVVQKLTYEY